MKLNSIDNRNKNKPVTKKVNLCYRVSYFSYIFEGYTSLNKVTAIGNLTLKINFFITQKKFLTKQKDHIIKYISTFVKETMIQDNKIIVLSRYLSQHLIQMNYFKNK